MFCGKDMVCGAFVSRRPPYTPCIYSKLEPGGRVEKITEFGLNAFRVQGCGFACVLTSVDVIRDVQYQYGIKDYPFHQVRVGLVYHIAILKNRNNPSNPNDQQ